MAKTVCLVNRLDKKMTKHKTIFYTTSLIFLSLIFYNGFLSAESTVLSKTKGKIILQVEENGEAWYVDPYSEDRHYLGRPKDAFELMRKFGLGISNQDIQKIAISETSYDGPDSDGDGLSDLLEDSLGSNKHSMDSDSDGYSDLEELKNNYQPNGDSRIEVDDDFSTTQLGRILVQVEQNGEAWYINPSDKKRYFLGRPRDAYSVMRQTGLGISNENIEKIAIWQENKQSIASVATENRADLIYSDDNFSFVYPSTWKSSKTSGEKGELIVLRNYTTDILTEKKAMISIAYIDNIDTSELSKFQIASKDGANKEKSEFVDIKSFKALSEVFAIDDIDAKETSTYLALSDTEMLLVSLFSVSQHSSHQQTLNQVLSSIEYNK